MLFNKVERDHIFQGIKAYEEEGIPPGFKNSTTYNVIYNNKLYPPKVIMVYANFYASDRKIEWYFSGGEGTECFNVLAEKGFVIIKKNYQNQKVNVQRAFAYWLLENQPPSYKIYIGDSIESILKSLDEIGDFFRPEKIFEIDISNFKKTINFLKRELNKNNRDKRTDFFEYDSKNGNGVPKAILGKNNFIKFLENNVMVEKNLNISKIEIDKEKVYKLSMGTFLKSSEFKNKNLLKRFEEKNWAVMGRYTTGNQGSNWLDEVKIGDYFYITFGQDKLSYLAKVTSNFKELPEDINEAIGNDDYVYREYEIVCKSLKSHTRELTNDKRSWLPSGYSTLKQIFNINEANKLLFKPYYNIEFVGNGKRFNKGIYDIEVSKNNIVANQIFYGPPGTGKTYQTVEKAIQILAPKYYKEHKESREDLVEKFKELIISNWSDTKGQVAFCTFHQSFAYEDFVEGIKPKIIDDKDIIYDIQKGIFKALCDRARTATNDSTNFDTVINRLQNKILQNGVITLKTDRGNKFDVNYTGQTTFRIKPHESSVENPQYPAAIENIRMLYEGAPLTDLYNPSYVKGILEYLYSDFDLPVYDKVKDSDKPYVIIIDEINRGNVASIFGELITLIEPDKRSGGKEELSVILPYSKKEFTVPNNIYIIGTMNTADRSVEALDSALRRRFSFKEIQPNPELIDKILKEKAVWNGISLSEVLITINKRITALIDRDHQIGHSYFLKLKDIDENEFSSALKNVFSQNIIPLLQEYFFNDFVKIGMTVGKGFIDVQPSNENLFAKMDDSLEDDYSDVKDCSFIDLEKLSDEAFISVLHILLNKEDVNDK